MSNRWHDSWDDLLSAKTHSEGQCLIWDSGCHSQGYPMVRWNGKMQMVKRVMMERKLDITLEKDQRVKNNTCNNIKCVNPDHHFIAELGTQEWKCVSHQYTDEQRADIRRIFDEYKHPTTGSKNGAGIEIRKHYEGISRVTVNKILKQKT